MKTLRVVRQIRSLALCAALAVPAMTGAALLPSEAAAQEFQAVEGEKIVFRIAKPEYRWREDWGTPNQAVRYSILTDAATGVPVAGRATPGKDYRAPRGKLVFGAARKFATFRVATHADDIEEGRETFRLVLADPEWAVGFRPGEGSQRHQRQVVWERATAVPQRIELTGVIVDR